LRTLYLIASKTSSKTVGSLFFLQLFFLAAFGFVLDIRYQFRNILQSYIMYLAALAWEKFSKHLTSFAFKCIC